MKYNLVKVGFYHSFSRFFEMNREKLLIPMQKKKKSKIHQDLPLEQRSTHITGVVMLLLPFFSIYSCFSVALLFTCQLSSYSVCIALILYNADLYKAFLQPLVSSHLAIKGWKCVLVCVLYVCVCV